MVGILPFTGLESLRFLSMAINLVDPEMDRRFNVGSSPGSRGLRNYPKARLGCWFDVRLCVKLCWPMGDV